MSLPFISALMATFGRPLDKMNLLEESVESFLRRDYPADHRELIILNDLRGQDLVFEAPGVRVINCPSRYPTLGEKHNAMCAAAHGEILTLFDDDDISLPWRLSMSIEKMGEANLYCPRCYWFMPPEGLKYEQNTGNAHVCSAFRRSALERAGGYPPMVSGYDAVINERLRQMAPIVYGPPLPPDETFYIYRWGVSDRHISGYNDPVAVYSAWNQKKWPPGTFEIRPHWHADYVAMTRKAAAEIVGRSVSRSSRTAL